MQRLSQEKHHVGKQVNLAGDYTYELYPNETLTQDDKTLNFVVQKRAELEKVRGQIFSMRKLLSKLQLPNRQKIDSLNMILQSQFIVEKVDDDYSVTLENLTTAINF